MEAWDILGLSNGYWRPGTGPQKLDFERQALACNFPWPFQRRKQPQNGYGIIWIRTCGPCVQFPSMALKKGSENANSRKEKLFKINLIMEAEVEDGQQLYITGSDTSLGTWEPELAICMSPCEGKTNLWQADIQVPRGTTLEYNYFVRGGKSTSDEIIWKPGPTMCFSVPSRGRLPNKKLVVQDSWSKIAHRKLQVPPWGNRWQDIRPASQPSGFADLEFSGASDFSSAHSDGNMEEVSDQLLKSPSGTGSATTCDVSTGLISSVVDTRASAEQNKIHSKLLRKGVLQGKDSDVCRLSKNLEGQKILVYQPVEEPWLPGSFILIKEKSDFENLTKGIRLDKGATFVETKQCLQKEFKSENDVQSLESQTKQEGTGMVTQKKDAITEIIINSSVCTIQRIAILEDGKPVEILLEQEEEGTKVHAGNIYLGVVKQLLPKMGAAFVDIGCPNKALLNIEKDIEPFVFPSLDSEVETSSKDDETEVNELLECAVQEDEMSIYEDAVDEEEAIGEAFEDSGNVAEVNIYTININNVSSVDMENGCYLNENGKDTEGCGGEQCGNGDCLTAKEKTTNGQLQNLFGSYASPSSGDFAQTLNNRMHVKEGTKIIVQVRKEELRNKGPQIAANPELTSRFWVLLTRKNRVGVSHNINGEERKRLKKIAETLQPPDFGLTVRTAAYGHSYEELQKDLTGLMETWRDIVEHAKSAVLAAEKGVKGAIPVLLHRGMPKGQTRSVVQDYFNEEVRRMVVDSPHTYHEVTAYLQEFAPSLVNRVELYKGKNPIFDEFGVETAIDNLLRKRVDLPNGGYLVIEETEALVSIDVNGGSGMLGCEMSREEANLKVNLAAARQIATELRLRDIGGIIVVDFIDMNDEKHKRMITDEMKKASDRDRSYIQFSELSELGLMEIARKRVRKSLTCMISEPCSCCDGNGRVEALHTTFSKIEHGILRFLAKRALMSKFKVRKFWPRVIVWVDRVMFDYLISGEKTRIARLSSSLKVWIVLKINTNFERGQFEVTGLAHERILKDIKLQAAIAGKSSKRTHSDATKKKSKNVATHNKETH